MFLARGGDKLETHLSRYDIQLSENATDIILREGLKIGDNVWTIQDIIKVVNSSTSNVSRADIYSGELLFTTAARGHQEENRNSSDKAWC